MTGLYFFKPELLAEWNEPTLKYAPWVAVILAAANLAIIEALAGIPASAGSTVYRLNSVVRVRARVGGRIASRIRVMEDNQTLTLTLTLTP